MELRKKSARQNGKEFDQKFRQKNFRVSVDAIAIRERKLMFD
jgi:hypothetical protein